MKFAKYQGLGNDFIFVRDLARGLTIDGGLARALCDRRRGIGADGLIRVANGDGEADYFMDYFNADGSTGEVCGNGIRCLALFVRDEGLSQNTSLTIGTRAGLRTVERLDDTTVRAGMGVPLFRPDQVPVFHEGSDALHVPVVVSPGETVEVSCLSMGNPHAVVFLEEGEEVDVRGLGEAIESNSIFPNGANVEFTTVLKPDAIDVKVWERGSGETPACGTGACAAAVAARVLRGCDETIAVHQPGGTLEVMWPGSADVDAPAYMTGSAHRSFEGTIDLDVLRGALTEVVGA